MEDSELKQLFEKLILCQEECHKLRIENAKLKLLNDSLTERSENDTH